LRLGAKRRGDWKCIYWGCNKNNHKWKSPKFAIQNLVDIAGKGGNYLKGPPEVE